MEVMTSIRKCGHRGELNSNHIGSDITPELNNDKEKEEFENDSEVRKNVLLQPNHSRNIKKKRSNEIFEDKRPKSSHPRLHYEESVPVIVDKTAPESDDIPLQSVNNDTSSLTVNSDVPHQTVNDIPPRSVKAEVPIPDASHSNKDLAEQSHDSTENANDHHLIPAIERPDSKDDMMRPQSRKSQGPPESICSRLSSSSALRLDSRPSTTAGRIHSASSRKTISRASSRKSRQGSATSKVTERGQSSESEDEVGEGRGIDSEMDFRHVDILDEKAFDTDLEDNEPTSRYDHTGKTAYVEACRLLGVVPASFFLRHMHDAMLTMKHHGLGMLGMKAIAMSLVSNTKVLTLNLQDNWLGTEGGLAVCEMLKDNCFITDLDLSDNHLGSEVAEAFCKVITHNDTLQRVTLAGNEFNDKSAVFFADALLTTKLEYLNLSHNHFGEMAGIVLGPAISENLTLKELDLSWNHLRRKGAIAVAMGIKTNVFMKKVNLSWNGFGLEGAVGIADLLRGNSVLEELDITNNRITTEGTVLIGKGLSTNENLQVLKMGKNPMQTGGCWAICQAILRNPGCVIKQLDFSDILVNKDFNEIFHKVQEQIPDIKMTHGGMEPPLKPKVRVHPMVKLVTYIEKNNLRLVDFFNKFDKDKSMSVTHDEFKEGIQETGILLNDEEINQLIMELDRDGDGEINYSEMVIGHTDFKEQERKISTAHALRPMTS